VCPKTTAILYGRKKEQERTYYALVAALFLGIIVYLTHIHSRKKYKNIYLLHHRCCLVLKGPPLGGGPGFDPRGCMPDSSPAH
jgi:hypothetical protein